VLLFTGYSIIKDAQEFKEKFSTSDNVFLLKDNTTILSGAEMINGSDGTSFRMLSKNELKDMQESYDKFQFNDIKDDYYKVVVFDVNAIDRIKEYNITEQDIVIKSKNMKELLLSDAPKEDIAKIMAEEKDISYKAALAEVDNIKEEELKGYLFSVLISEYFIPKNINEFLLGLKNNDVSVYKETAMFKAVKIIPRFLMKSILSGNSTQESLLNNTNTTLV
jgi:hypothetical protein